MDFLPQDIWTDLQNDGAIGLQTAARIPGGWLNRLWRAQTDAIEAAAAAGETDVTVSSVPQNSRFTMAVTLEDSPDAWPNSTLGRYYGVRVHGR